VVVVERGELMPHAPTPWIGLAALVAMFVLPFLPSWLFEGPRRIEHRPQRHVCADCGAPWTKRHVCEPATVDLEAAEAGLPLRAELRRLPPSTELEPRSGSELSR
jgi:hypothetical protein